MFFLLMWLLGVPLGIIILLWLLGVGRYAIRFPRATGRPGGRPVALGEV